MTAAAESTVADILDVFLQASTTPCVVVTESGEKWVMKLAGAGHGPRGLLTELIAGRVARAMGAPVPDMQPLYLPAGFPWRVGTDEFDGALQRSFGWNLGVAYVEDARPASAADLGTQPPTLLASIAASDRFLQNMDRTARHPNLLLVADGSIRSIDYDACLFLDRAIAHRASDSFALPAGHILQDWTLPEATCPLPVGVLGDAVDDAPRSWLDTVRVPARELRSRLNAYATAAAVAMA